MGFVWQTPVVQHQLNNNLPFAGVARTASARCKKGICLSLESQLNILRKWQSIKGSWSNFICRGATQTFCFLNSSVVLQMLPLPTLKTNLCAAAADRNLYVCAWNVLVLGSKWWLELSAPLIAIAGRSRSATATDHRHFDRQSSCRKQKTTALWCPIAY